MFTLRSCAMRGARFAAPIRTAQRPFSSRAPLLSHGDYGSPDGDPRAADPQAQGKNPKSDQEHPGPPSPSGDSTKSSGDTSQSQQSSSGSKGDAQPKLTPKSKPDSESADVKKHNEDFASRGNKEKANVVDGDDKVDPKYWKGHAEDKAE